MEKVGFAELGAVAQEHLFRCVFYHRFSNYVFFFKAIVNFAVVIHRPRGEERNIRVEVFNHLFRVMPDEHRTVEFLHAPARRVGGDIVFGKERKGVDAVRDNANIFKFGEIFRG